MPIGGSAGDGGVTKQENARQQRINAGMSAIDKAFSGFNNSFYNQRSNDYTAYALPQVSRQYQDTKNSLAYALARNGLMNSGASVSGMAKLNATRDQNLSNIANEAQNQSNALRTQVASNKTNVVNQLESSADPTLANESALQATAGLNAPPAYAPLGNMFSDFANNYIANITARSYAPNNESILSLLGNNQSAPSGGNSYMVP